MKLEELRNPNEQAKLYVEILQKLKKTRNIWTKEENDSLFEVISKHGEDWGQIGDALPFKALYKIK